MAELNLNDLKVESIDDLPDPTPHKSTFTPPKIKPKTDKRPTGRPSKASKETELEQEFQAFIALMAMPVSMRDPVCATAWIESSKPIAEALAAIAIDNPTIVKWMSQGGDVMKWFKLATALYAPARVTWEHHFAKPQMEPEYAGRHAAG